jgi:hypothetical protein
MLILEMTAFVNREQASRLVVLGPQQSVFSSQSSVISYQLQGTRHIELRFHLALNFRMNDVSMRFNPTVWASSCT